MTKYAIKRNGEILPQRFDTMTEAEIAIEDAIHATVMSGKQVMEVYQTVPVEE